MANNKNFKKCVAFTAVIGTILAAAATFVTRLHLKKKAESEKDSDNFDDFDTVDFESIHNDTPRDYVSIKINNNNEI